MGFEADFYDLMPATVIVYPFASRSADGHSGFSTSGTAYRARVVYAPENVRLPNGHIQASDAVAWLASTSPMSIQSKYLLPDGTSPQVFMVENLSDENGQHHSKVYFGASQARIR